MTKNNLLIFFEKESAVCCKNRIIYLDILILQDGTDKLSRSIGNKLPTDAKQENEDQHVRTYSLGRMLTFRQYVATTVFKGNKQTTSRYRLRALFLWHILVALSTNVYRISKFLTNSPSRAVTEISGVSWKCKTNYHIQKKPIRDHILSY